MSEYCVLDGDGRATLHTGFHSSRALSKEELRGFIERQLSGFPSVDHSMEDRIKALEAKIELLEKKLEAK